MMLNSRLFVQLKFMRAHIKDIVFEDGCVFLYHRCAKHRMFEAGCAFLRDFHLFGFLASHIS